MTRPACWIAACLTAAATLMTQHAVAQQPTAAAAGQPAGELRVYFGTYTGKTGSKGIYVASLDLKSGKLSTPELAGETINPSFLAIHPGKRFLYAVGEVSEINGKKAGGVSAFAIGSDGKLAPLNVQPSGGQGPCHISLDRAGRNALVANYGSGSVACLPIKPDGTLAEPSATIQHEGSSIDPNRQKGPHAHSINLDPANRFAFAADLGLDKVLVYKFDPAAGTLAPNDPPAAAVKPGSGPRHFAFHPTGKYAYVINEMASTVTALAYDAGKGTLTELHTVPTLPGEVKGNSTAEVVVHPSGKFVYGSNRGHDSIAAFTVDEASGKLTPAGHTPTGGKTPRNFNVDPTGTYLLAANQGSGTVVVFRIDPQTGKLSQVGEPVAVPAPVCVRFVQP